MSGSGSIQRIVNEALEDILEPPQSKGGLKGLSTGFGAIDRHTGGLCPGQMTVVAGVARTAFVSGVAWDVAVRQGVPVLFLSLSQGRKELVTRLLCAHAGVPFGWQGSTVARDEESKARLRGSAGMLARAPLFIEHDPWSISALNGFVKHYQDARGIGLCVIDELDCLGLVADEFRYEAIERVAKTGRAVRETARELGIPVLASAQVSSYFTGRQWQSVNFRLFADEKAGHIASYAHIVLFLEGRVIEGKSFGELRLWISRESDQCRVTAQDLRMDQKTTAITAA